MTQRSEFHLQLSTPLDDENSVYDVYQGDILVAKVKGKSLDNKTVIPLKELSDEEEDELYQYLDGGILS